MLLLFACFLFLVGICLILLLPAVWAEQTYRIYRDEQDGELSGDACAGVGAV